jgi:predicted RNA-binding protein YlxR (DUF448 family)
VGRADPERTCVGCRSRSTKGLLVRIARTVDGHVRVDPSGAMPGRGAWVHRDPSCAEAALRKGVLAHALRRGLGESEVGKLRHELHEHLGGS